MFIFFFLSYLYVTESFYFDEKINYLDDVEYGFKKNAKVLLNITNTTTQMVFGFATKKEIKKLKSMDLDTQYCYGKEQLTNIQFLINKSINSYYFTIPSKSVLTPYSIPCKGMYQFYLYLEIKNGSNSLDYRYQTLMIVCLVFSILFLISGLALLIYLFLSCEKGFNFIFCHIMLFFFIIMTGIDSLFIYFDFNKSKNNEFIKTDKHDFITSSLSYLFAILHLFLIHFGNTYKKGQEFYFIFISIYEIACSVCIIIIILLHYYSKNLFLLYFLIPSIYLFMTLVTLTLAFRFSMTRVAYWIFFGSNFFYFPMREFYFSDQHIKVNICTMLLIINYLSVISNFIVITLLLVGTLYFHDSFYYMKINNEYELRSDNEKENKEEEIA